MKLYYYIVLITFGFLSTGCVHNPVTTGVGTALIPASSQSLDQTQLEKYVSVDNSTLANRLSLTQSLARYNNQYLQVNVTVKSDYHKSQKLQYQFSWFDNEGFELDAGKQNWQAIDLHGGQQTQLTGLAKNKQATHFKLYIRDVATQLQRF
jgi:uncharacterized protein YcfL